MTAPGVRWAVVHRAARRGAQPELWLVIEAVPASVKMAEVRAALEEAAWWPSWQKRIGLGATLRVIAERSWPTWVHAVADADNAIAHEQWARLTPPSRRLSIPLEGGAYADVRRTAAARGMSMQAWAAAVLAREAAVWQAEQLSTSRRVDEVTRRQIEESAEPQTVKVPKRRAGKSSSRRINETTKQQSEVPTDG